MEYLHLSAPDKKIFLSASGTKLYAHTFQNERLFRSALLCSNYDRGLSCASHHDFFYYTYINKEQSLLLRRLGESALQLRLDCTGTLSYHAPELFSFGNRLFLPCFEQKHNLFYLKLQVLFSDVPAVSLPAPLAAGFPSLPTLQIQPANQFLYLCLSAENTEVVVRYDTVLSPEQLFSEEEFSARLRLPWEAEKTQLEQQLQHLAQHVETQQALLVKSKEQLQAQNTLLAKKDSDLQTVQTLLAKKDAEIASAGYRLNQTTRLLEQAKAQYEELMHVAEQYKEEAAKWYRKFTDKH